jgi:hypothetical protein
MAFGNGNATAQVATVKLELYNHQVWLKVGLTGPGSDTLNFLFDSGAGAGLLDSAVARRIFRDGHFGDITGTGAGGSTRMQMLENREVFLGGIRVDSVTLLVNNLDNLSSTLGRRLDGIIGYSLLKKFVTRIDLDEGTLSLYKDIGDVKAEKGRPLDFEFSPEIGFLPRVSGRFTTVEGEAFSGWFFMDSGAGLTAMLNTPMVNAHRLLGRVGKTLRLKTVGMTSSSDRYIARIKDFSFGGYVFKDVPLSLSQVTSGVNAMEGYWGLLGNEFLFRFNLTFDYVHNAIYLQPNKYYATPFEFPLCGFAVKLVEGKVCVASIAPDAPEAVQGLATGDVIVGVNGKTDVRIEEVREVLKHPGKVMLQVRRGDVVRVLKVDLFPRV